jgi:hypothetical protein
MRRINATRSVTVIAALTGLTAALVGVGPGTATAAGAKARIEASPQRVALDGNPWVPTGHLAVVVKNHGPGTARGHFLVHLPNGVDLARRSGCTRADGPHQPAYVCGGKSLRAGATATYRVALRSTTAQPVFGVRARGWVEGKNLRGAHGKRKAFAITWPARLPVRLAVTAGPRTGRHVDVAVRVTNAGRATLRGYSLNVTTPAGVTVVAPACSTSGRMNGVGCEVYRSRPVRAGRTDAFTVRLAVGDVPRTVRLFLAPGNRYLNRDTSVAINVGGARAARPAAVPAR